MGPTGARVAAGAKCLAPGGRKCLCPPAHPARAVLTCSASSPDSGVGLTAPHGEEVILFGKTNSVSQLASPPAYRKIQSTTPNISEQALRTKQLRVGSRRFRRCVVNCNQLREDSIVDLSPIMNITIQNITGERFLHGNERSGLREGSSAASFFRHGWNFFPAETDLFSLFCWKALLKIRSTQNGRRPAPPKEAHRNWTSRALH